jgi:membrane protein DedA with SNARE-associated domain
MVSLFSADVGLNHYIEVFGYLGIFLFYVTLDQVTFVPEEVTLISIGYLSSTGVFNPLIAGIVALTAFLAVDTAYFYVSGSGMRLFRRLKDKVKKAKTGSWKEKLQRDYPKTLILLCFIPRMRMLAPIISGILKITYKRFLLFDSIGLLLFTCLYIAIGYFFHKGLHSLMAKLKPMQHIIFISAMLLLSAYIIIAIRKHKKAGA